MKINKKLFAYLLVIVSTLAATFTFYFWQIYTSPNLNLDSEENFALFIPKGATYQQVLDSLNEHRIINDQIAFGFMTKIKKYRELVKPGRYEIPPKSGNNQIINKLRLGEQDPVTLTFNNIRTKEELAEKVGDNFSFGSEALLNLLNDKGLVESYGFDEFTIMNMFLPDTYYVYWTVTPEEFMGRMKHEYDSFWTEDRQTKAKNIQMNPNQVGTMASIVQSETNKRDEMPTVAGVYVNRIALGMLLQADPTVKFATGDFGLRRILNKHLTIDSPYNTYKYKGLPPGPIALPEKVAIDAVLNYQKHDYIYFSAKEDFSGYHNFAANYNQHLVNARKYHAALNERGIK